MQQVWAKQLAGGGVAVPPVNVGQPTLSDLPISSLAPALLSPALDAPANSSTVRDIWAHANLPDIEATVSLHFERGRGPDPHFLVLMYYPRVNCSCAGCITLISIIKILINYWLL